MGRRGPKPVHMGTLNTWEFEWYKAFHLLRDGIQLPTVEAQPAILTPREVESRMHWLQQVTIEKYWAELRREAGKPFRPPNSIEREWAESERHREIFNLQLLKPKEIYARAERREIWNALIRARTLPALRKACQRWERLADVREKGFQCFSAHVVANGKQFLWMKRNQRFPRSADDSRVEYLARGMAGLMVGVSPMTAIERLRNMRHDPEGPLWDERARQCGCWRCSIERFHKVEEFIPKETSK